VKKKRGLLIHKIPRPSATPFGKGGESERDLIHMPIYQSYLKEKARNLRKSMTPAEVRLWVKIRRKQIKGLQFYRQKPLGKYIVDFYCPAKRLVIEIDGGQHYEKEHLKKDKQRDNYLEQILGLKVIRFTNRDILTNLESVINKIISEID